MKTNGEFEKIIGIGYLVIILFLIIIMRLWQLQILQGDEYRKLSETNRFKIINIPAPRGIIFDRNGIPLVRNTAYYYASLIPNEFDKKKIAPLSQLLNIPADEILSKIDEADVSPFVTVRLKEGLTFDEIAYIEARRSDFPGLIIEEEVSREYIYNELGAHLIGHLGRLSPAQSKDPAFRDIPPETFIGQWGIEKLYDSSLRGVPGKKIIEVNALGREIRLLKETSPEKGDDITLSLDVNLQKGAELAFGERAGALVAIKPKSGEILGMVSKPSFDPNLFSRGISNDDWVAITSDPKKPMLNRALQSQYPPGSTFKIVTAIAGLEERVINPQTDVDCRGGISYGQWRFGCWRKEGHGTVSLHRAIVESCDVYFYEVGRRLGIDKIAKHAINFGFSKKTGIELDIERDGVIPSTQWKMENKKLPWFLGETFNAAIGQGYVSVTPIQLAVFASAVANGGTIYKPTLLKDAQPVISGETNVSPETIELIKSGLFGVVNEPGGTAYASRSTLTNIAGKTGTAQVVSMKSGIRYLSDRFKDHAWFFAFAPFENPEIAVAVLVEHGGHGGSAAAPIAKKAIEEYINSFQSLDH